MAKAIMLQGTSSHVGKSILATALCRIFLQDGKNVVPFKAQNMALNSYVTKSGGEMGRAQVVQAEAAGLEPQVEMNPVLLKPSGNSCSQVILMGNPIGNMSAQQYHQGYSLQAWHVVEECIDKLQQEYEVLVIEGAGSPAEVNLKATDIVNMRVAKRVPAPVLLVADIDRGGCLAFVVGTLELLDSEERDLVKGIIINKFRGDIRLLQPGLDFLEQKTGKPIIGVIPYLDTVDIDDEDSVSLDDKRMKGSCDLEVAVLRTPKISNFTDFDALEHEPDVQLRYVRTGEKIGRPDMVILPGSKNTTQDLIYLKEQGYEQEIQALVQAGIPIVGICGGYQMLGEKIFDPLHTESEVDAIDGLGLLPITTEFAANKVTRQVRAACEQNGFLGCTKSFHNLVGYEIHMGKTQYIGKVTYAFLITERSGEKTLMPDGVVSDNGLVLGTYIHGIWDDDDYRRTILNVLRGKKGLRPLPVSQSVKTRKENAYNRLAQTVRDSLNMELVYRILNNE